MTDPTIAKTARPPATAIAWATKDSILVEFPTPSGVPFLSRFPKTAAGLQSALNILLENPSPRVADLRQVGHPSIRRPGDAAKAEVREAAADIVRKMLLK